MRQLTYLEPGRLSWTEVPDPVPGPDDVVARPLAVARCDLDAAMVAAGLFTGPFPVGHEVVAEVVAVGRAVTGWHGGERVVVPFQVSCGACIPCADQRYAACATHRARAGAAFGFGPDGGGHGGAMADLLLVPHADHLLQAAPPAVPLAALASLSDNVADGYRTVAGPLVEHPGSEVLIIGGAGDSIGFYALVFAQVLGAGGVRYVDTDPGRCATAEVLGAEVELVEGSWPRRFPRALVTVCYTIEAEGLAAAIASTDDYGHCTSTSIQFSPMTPLPLLAMYTRGITLHTSRVDSRRYLPEVLDHVVSGAFDPLVVPTTVVGWDEAADAWPEPGTKLVVSDEAT